MRTRKNNSKSKAGNGTRRDRRPNTGKRVSTGQEGIYRYVSARGPEHDTFTIKVGSSFAGTYYTLEDAMVARGRIKQAPLDVRRMTCTAFAANYWEQLYSDHRANVTIRNNRYAIQPFLDTFGDRRPGDISRLEAQQWAKKVNIDNVRVARAMLNDAADAGLLRSRGDNPLSNPRLPVSRGRADQTPPSIETVLNMAAVARVHFPDWGPVLASLIEFDFGSLLRPGEAFELKWENVDFADGYIEVLGNLRRDRSVGKRKMGQSTVVALLPVARRALLQLPRRLDSPYVFTTPTGRQVTHTWLQDYWTQLRQYYAGQTNQPDIAKLHFYLATRHAGASWLLNTAGVTDADLRYQLGHRNRRTGNRAVDQQLQLVSLYSHPKVVKALERIKEAVSRQPLP